MSDPYTFDSLWRSSDGHIMLRRRVLVEDVDGQPLGVLVTDERYYPDHVRHDDDGGELC